MRSRILATMTIFLAPALLATDAEFSRLSRIAAPRAQISLYESRKEIAEGIGVAAIAAVLIVSGARAEYEVAEKVVDIAVEGSIGAVERHNALMECDLRIIDADATALKKLVRKKRDPSEDEAAKALADRLKARMRVNDSTATFYRRAVFSKGGLYEFAIAAGLSRIRLKEGLGKRLAAPVRFAWRDAERTLRGSVRGGTWKKIKRRSKIAEKLTAAWIEQSLDALFKHALREGVDWSRRRDMAACYEDRLNAYLRDGRPYRIEDLRIDSDSCGAFGLPDRMMPTPVADAVQVLPVPVRPDLRAEEPIKVRAMEPVYIARPVAVAVPVKAVPIQQQMIATPVSNEPPAVPATATTASEPATRTTTRINPKTPDLCKDKSWDGDRTKVCPP